MRFLFGSLVALSLASDLAVAAPVAVTVFDRARPSMKPHTRRSSRSSGGESRPNAFGFTGEINGPKDGRQFIQLDRGNGIAWFDGPAKAKLTHEESGETFYFVSPARPGLPDSMRLIFWDSKLECGWPEELRSK